MPHPSNRFSQPPAGASGSPDKVAAWIAANVPCSEGIISVEWTYAVYREAARWNVSSSTVRAALLIARKYGLRFVNFGTAVNVEPKQKELRDTSPEEIARCDKYTLEVLEAKYKIAEATNDISGMEAALAAALKILWEIAKGYAKVKQAQRPEKMVEWEEFNRAVNEAQDRAETLTTHFRRLTRDDVARLREAPTPGDQLRVRYRIVDRVRPRPVRTPRK